MMTATYTWQLLLWHKHDCHVVVVDDGSPSPLDPGWISAETGLAPDRLTLLRNDTPTGPGAARNRALAHVPTPHLLFVDADDLVTPDLPDLMADLVGRDFDFCIFRHFCLCLVLGGGEGRGGEREGGGGRRQIVEQQKDWHARFRHLWRSYGV